MKRKFSLMWRAVIALALVLSLGMVMAAPVSAQGALTTVSATPSNTMAGVTATYTIAFTTATQAVVGTVDMAFASGFDVSGATYSSESGISTVTISASGQVVTATVTSPATVNAGQAVTIVFSGIVNPAAAAYSPAVTITTKYTNGNDIDVGTAAVTITALPASFKVTHTGGGAVTATAGTVFAVKITALKADGVTTESNYTGNHLIGFTSTASAPKTIPAFEVLNFSSGVVTTSTSFLLNVGETGKTITATDSALSITGTSAAIVVTIGGLDRLTVTGAPTTVTAGVPFSADITVNAEDSRGNVIVDNVATVTWTSSDGAAVFPAAHALVAGTWTFTGSGFTLKESGAQTITATEGGASNANAVAITVSAAAASKMAAANSATPITANGYASSTITGTVQDAYSNTATTSTATITFETSVGEFANGASTYSVAAVAGVATAVLTSSDAGTATVRVTSGSLTYATTAVVLTLDAAPTVVWVDDGYIELGYNDGHVWGTDAFDTIEEGTDAVAAGGTVNVLPGTYDAESFPIQIDTAGVTLQSTGTAAETIIDATGQGLAVQIGGTPGSPVTTVGVTVDGFTITADSEGGIFLAGADDAIIQNNVIGGGTTVIDVSRYASGVTISGNTVDEFGSIFVHESDCTLTDNHIGRDILLWPLAAETIEGTIITDNTFTDNGDEAVNGAINFFGSDSGSAIKDTLIEGNSIASRDQAGIRIGSTSGTTLTIEDLTITGNDITNNNLYGIHIYDVESWSTGNTISYNNITGNLTLGIKNEDAAIINAKNNWWGDASGPYNAATNAAATGDAVDALVNYRPWLTSAYGVTPVTTISLVTGWNLISLPLYIPLANRGPATLLAAVTDNVDIVWGDYDPATGSWHTYVPGATNDLTAMRDGKGYWVNMTAADTLDVSTLGTELPEAPAAPPTYDVVEGWNLIGLKSTSATTASTYLAALGTNYTMIYGFANGVYSTVQSTDSLEPGYGYWIAVTAVGTIYP